MEKPLTWTVLPSIIGSSGQREVPVRDRAAERALLGLLHVDVDPLVVAGGLGELVARSCVISSQSL